GAKARRSGSPADRPRADPSMAPAPASAWHAGCFWRRAQPQRLQAARSRPKKTTAPFFGPKGQARSLQGRIPMQIQQSQGAKTVGAGGTFARVQADAPTGQTASASADVGTVAPASGVVAAAQQHGVVTQDGFTIAKPREPSAQPVTKIKDAGPAKR